MTADGTGGHEDHVRRRREVQPEGGGAAIEGGGGGGGARRGGGRSGEGPPAPGAPGGRPAGCRSLSQREDEDDAATVMLQCSTSIIATVLVPAVKWVYVTVTHSRYQNRTSVTGFNVRYS